jgi:hypothetical protein
VTTVEGDIEELLRVIQRELGAASVRIDEPVEATDDDPLELTAAVPAGRRVVVRFGAEPSDRAAAAAKLALLVDGFRDLLSGDPPRPPREHDADALQDALSALATRAGARDAVVIDAHSPIVWGSSGQLVEDSAPVIALSSAWRDALGADEVLRTADRFGVSASFEVEPEADAAALIPRSICLTRRVAPLRAEGESLELAMANPGDFEALHDAALATGLSITPVAAPGAAIATFAGRRAPDVAPAEASAARAAFAAAQRDAWSRRLVTRSAVLAVRALPEIETLSKGGHLHQVRAEATFGYAAHSFAQIYVLVVVFDGPFDELGARRATTQALPIIERLVLALPPRDPSTGGRPAVAAAARPRRRG